MMKTNYHKAEQFEFPFVKPEQTANPIVEALKETDRHAEELYRQAGEGRIVTDGLAAARERAAMLTKALTQSCYLVENKG